MQKQRRSHTYATVGMVRLRLPSIALKFVAQPLTQSSLGYKKYAPAFRFGHSLATNEPCRSQS